MKTETKTETKSKRQKTKSKRQRNKIKKTKSQIQKTKKQNQKDKINEIEKAIKSKNRKRRMYMKYFIASDIHGSAHYCQLMLDRYKAEGADRMILLGDLLYHGPRNDLPHGYAPKKVIEMLNTHKNEILCVKGNCEADVDQMVLEFPVLAEYAILEHGDRMIFVTHGHKFNTASMPPIRKNDILLHGHTHVPACENVEGMAVVYCNPGSVSIPKEDSPHSYMILENGVMTWKDLDGKAYKEYKL